MIEDESQREVNDDTRALINGADLSVLSCRLDDIGSQRCWLGPEFMSANCIQLHEAICIDIDSSTSCICRAWPRLDATGNQYVQFDATVTRNVVGGSPARTPSSSHTPTFADTASVISQSAVHSLTCSAAESISLTVVIARRSELVVYRCDAGKLLESRLRLLLDGVLIAEHCQVLCSRMTLGHLYGWDRIVLHDIKSTRGTDCVFVAPSTKINIAGFVSLDRYLQRFVRVIKLGGLDHEVQLLKEIVVGKRRQDSGQDQDASSVKEPRSRGVLLVGPAGCGKTSLVRHIAAECDAFLIKIDSNIHGSRPGESEHNLRTVFRQAVDAAVEGPCILLLENLESICPRSREDSETLGRRLLAELQCLMDGLASDDTTKSLVVVAATNKPSDVDPSLRRVGRFEKEIFLGIPDQCQRHDILRAIVPHNATAADIDLQYLASATPGYTGADLTSLVQLAAVSALQRSRSGDDSGSLKRSGGVGLTLTDFQSALHSARPSSQRGSDIFITDIRPVTWSDIGGLEDVKIKLQQSIEWPLKYPEAFRCLGLRPPRGVLLYGPPGCAKTSMVRAAATSCHVNFLAVSGAQLYSPFLGDAEKKIAEVFHQARMCAPSILFIDEIDSVIGSRAANDGSSGSGGLAVQQRVLSTLLNEMDGIGIHVDDLQRQPRTKMAAECSGNDADVHCAISVPEPSVQVPVDNASVIVVAATNRIDMVDKALLRPGRMDHVIYVPLPDCQARLEILKVHTRQKPFVDVNLEDIAQKTEGYTGADLENLCNETCLQAVKIEGFDCRQISGQHFNDVLLRLKPSVIADDLLRFSDQIVTD